MQCRTMKLKSVINYNFMVILICLLLYGCSMKQEYQYEALSTGGIVLTKYYGHASTLVIPSEYDGKEVKSVSNIIHNNKGNKLKKAVVSEGIEDTDAIFVYCTSLEEVELPHSLISMGGGDFNGCTSLTEVTIPSSVQEMWSAEFYNCSNLKRVIYEDGVSGDISLYCFDGCTSLEEVQIPASITYIVDTAFDKCNPDVVLKVKKDSYAENYAIEHNLNYEDY